MSTTKFAARVDEGGFGDVNFGGDAGKAPAFGAKMDEALLGLGAIHRWNPTGIETTDEHE